MRRTEYMGMLTENQKEAFRKIKEKVKVESGGLNAKQRGDFYYRMSKILKEEIEGLNDLVFLLNELPDSYLEKIDLRDAALSAMDLTEKLTRMLAPSPIAAPDEKGIRHVFRHFMVELPNPFPGMQTATASIKATYEPTSEEIVFFNQFVGHIGKLEEIYDENEHDPHHYTSEEFNKQILQPLRTSKKNVNAETVSIAGFVDKKEEPPK